MVTCWSKLVLDGVGVFLGVTGGQGIKQQQGEENKMRERKGNGHLRRERERVRESFVFSFKFFLFF